MQRFKFKEESQKVFVHPSFQPLAHKDGQPLFGKFNYDRPTLHRSLDLRSKKAIY
jgi:hypothetical protein